MNRSLPIFAGLLAAAGVARAELHVPASTAYTDHGAPPLHLSPAGCSGWNASARKIVWFGDFKTPGALRLAIAINPHRSGQTDWKIIVGTTARAVTVADGDKSVTLPAGDFSIEKPGYTRITLESTGPAAAAEIEQLVLDGPASRDAHFNLEERRNAASVHLRYPAPEGTVIRAFSCEVTALEDPVATFYMGCGFPRGYLGMQVNGPDERRIIFSVWDSGAGANANRRDSVAEEDQTRLLEKGEDVVASVFSGEGTGGHSHLVIPWKTGAPQRFAVTAHPAENGGAVFAGYWRSPEARSWKLLARFRAPKCDGALSGLHSFCENFDGANGDLPRKALFARQWARTEDGRWIELTKADFTTDATGRSARLDRSAGVESGAFYLSTGGFLPGTTPFGAPFTRTSSGPPPSDLSELPVD